MKYRKKPEIVTAIQWLGTKTSKNYITENIHDIWTTRQSGYLNVDEMVSWCITSENNSIEVNKNDFIVKDSNDNVYVYSPESFYKLYDKI